MWLPIVLVGAEHEEKQGHADIEPVIVKRIGPHQKLAAEMKRNGIDCQALEVGSHPIEQKPHYSYMFAHSSRLVTNRGIVKVRGKNIDFVQVLQRN